MKLSNKSLVYNCICSPRNKFQCETLFQYLKKMNFLPFFAIFSFLHLCASGPAPLPGIDLLDFNICSLHIIRFTKEIILSDVITAILHRSFGTVVCYTDPNQFSSRFPWHEAISKFFIPCSLTVYISFQSFPENNKWHKWYIYRSYGVYQATLDHSNSLFITDKVVMERMDAEWENSYALRSYFLSLGRNFTGKRKWYYWCPYCQSFIQVSTSLRYSCLKLTSNHQEHF